MKPLVASEDFAYTEKLVKDFIKPGGVGDKLQAFLLDRAAKTENWVSLLF